MAVELLPKILPNRLRSVSRTLGDIIFDPRGLSGLSMWVKADAGVTLNAGNVSAWGDQSGNGKHPVQATGAAQPLYVPNALNGLPGLRFDGVNHFMGTAGAVFSGAQARTMIVVYKPAVATGTMSVCGPDGAGTGTGFQVQTRVAPQGDPYFSGGSADLTGPAKDTLVKIACVTYDGTTVKLYKNGVVAVVNSGAIALNTTAIGLTISHTAEKLQGDVYEIICTGAVLTAAQFTAVHRYLGARWGITVP